MNRIAWVAVAFVVALPTPAPAATVTFSTYFGGSFDAWINALTTDSAGNIWVAGQTSSIDLPTTTGAFQRTWPAGGIHAFVAKFNPSGALIYSTFLAGSGTDIANGIAVDSQGNAYVTGSTSSNNFPVTAGSFSTTNKGIGTNAFITKVNPAGSALIYSTYIGGTDTDTGYAIAVDTAGEATVTGQTNSPDFPVTADTIQLAYGGGMWDAFVTRLNPAGTALVYSTYLGGSVDDGGFGVSLDANGNAYIAGSTESPDFPSTAGAAQPSLTGLANAFVTALNANGTALVYSTYLGGSNADAAYGIAVDSSANAWLTGNASSPDFPVTAGAIQPSLSGSDDAFISKLGPTGALLYSTFLGGPGDQSGYAISLDLSGDPWVAGYTNSGSFPLHNPTQTSLAGESNAFVTELSAAGTLAFSTYLGGSTTDLAYGISASASGSISVGGYTTSSNFPVTTGSLSGTSAGFLTVYTPAPALLLTASHNGDFTVGQNGATYSIAVSNKGDGPTSGQVIVTDTLPAGIAATAISGGGWNCVLGSLTCTRSDALPIASAYPGITVMVNVTAPSAELVTNQVSVTGGNSPSASASDLTLIAGEGSSAQTITFPAIANTPLSAVPLTLNATASSNLAVLYYSTTPAVCSVSGSSLSLLITGSCTVTAIQAGDATYAAASPVTRTFNITQGSETITFPAISVKALGAPPFAITATASSGLLITFTSDTPNVCITTGNIVNLIAAGSCSITASQAGNASYTAAAPVTQIFAVGPGTGAGGTAFLSPSSTTLTFTRQVGLALPQPQTLTVNASAPPGAFAAAVQTTSGGNWLSASVSGQASTIGYISVSVTPGSLGLGTYTGTVVVSAAGAFPIVVPVTLNVTINVPSTPVLRVSPGAARFVLSSSSAPAAGSIAVSNLGGGTLSYQATAAAGSGDWLSISTGGAGSLTAGAAALLGFTVNPAELAAGSYTGAITVFTGVAGGSQQIPITLVISQAPAALSLSGNALGFSSLVTAAAPPSQSFAVSNSGSGNLRWTTAVETLAGGSWLSVSMSAGTSIGGQPGIPVYVSVNPTGLAEGRYYGSIVVAAGAAAIPQTVSVVLSVLGSEVTGQLGISLSTGGVVLVGAAADTSTAQRQITIFNPATTSVLFNASITPAYSWLGVSSSIGALRPGLNTLTLSANFAPLSAGIETGSVTLTFSDFTSATIQVVAIATAAPSAAANDRQPHAAAAACIAGKPGSLIPIFDQPVAKSTLTAGIPAAIQIELFDDCGNPATAASGATAQISFSTTDPVLTLTDTGSGIWQADWVPAQSGASVSVRLSAAENGMRLNPIVPSSVSVTVLAAPANAAPRATGIVNAAAGGQAMPQTAAPSSYVAIYGSNLTAGVTASASTLPLPATLGGTQVFIGGQAAPLLYASPGQINAVVPQSLIAGQTYPLLIVSRVAQSVPSSLAIARYQPGVYTFDASGSGQAIAEIAGTSNLASAATPATRGMDYLQVFTTGLGPVAGPNGEAPPADGAAASSSILYSTTATVTATLGGVDAPVSFAGLTPTLVSLYQVNIQVPADAPAGNAVPLVITVTDGNGVTISSNTTTVALQ